MKRLVSVFLAMALLLAIVSAMAEGAVFEAPEKAPQAILNFFSKASFTGYAIGINSVLEGADLNGCTFVIAQKDGKNVLYGFRDGRHFLTTEDALPQGMGSFSLLDATGVQTTGTAFTQPTFAVIYQKPDNEEYWNLALYFSGNSSGQWNLSYVYANGMGTQFEECKAASDGLTMYFEGERLGAAYGVLETGLRYFSWDAFPKTLREARDKLTNPPDIPVGTLSAQRIKFTGGQKLEVYTGPGTHYERSGSGRAVVSTNDWIQVFGAEDGYILIQYDISSAKMRMGYIEASALPSGASVSPLYFDWEPARITRTIGVTDDPLNSRDCFHILSEGQEVTWLGTMGSWVYVEVTGPTQPYRGFVPADAVKKTTPRVYSAAFSCSEYTAQAAVKVEGNTLTAQIMVNGSSEAWSDRVTAYRVYANNLPVACQITGTAADAFALTAELPQGASVLGLCPERAQSGLRANEMILIRLTE